MKSWMTSDSRSSSPPSRSRADARSKAGATRSGAATRAPPRRRADGHRAACSDSRPCRRCRHRSRSPVMACAVMAMIRTCPPAVRFARTDRRGRLEAVHLRHLHVHQHDVERFACHAPPPPCARCRRPSRRGRACASTPHRDPLVDDVVFGDEHVRRLARVRRRRSGSDARRMRQRRVRVFGSSVRQIASSRSLCLIGLVRYAATPSARQRVRLAVEARRAQHHDRRAGQLRPLRDLRRRRRSRRDRACGCRAAPAETAGRLRAAAVSSLERLAARRSPIVGRMPQAVTCVSRMLPVHRVVVDDEDGDGRPAWTLIDPARGWQLRGVERDREMEGAAVPGVALQPDAPAHQPHQRRRDRQAQARAAEPARRRRRPPG